MHFASALVVLPNFMECSALPGSKQGRQKLFRHVSIRGKPFSSASATTCDCNGHDTSIKVTPHRQAADLWFEAQASPDGNLVAWARNACTAVVTSVSLRKDMCVLAVHSQQDKQPAAAKPQQMRIAEARWSCNGDLIALLQRPMTPAMDKYAVVSIHSASSGRLLHAEWYEPQRNCEWTWQSVMSSHGCAAAVRS